MRGELTRIGALNTRLRARVGSAGLMRVGAFLLLTLFLATGCAARSTTGISDEALAEQVRTALVNASDVPGSQLSVEVEDGVVTLRGSLACSDCGGLATPGGAGTVEQSVGAIVRAVPGVREVRFATAAGNEQ